MARTIYLRIAYDGTEFHGWQTQPGVRTVQSVLEQSLQRVARHPVDLVGSGRTDSGVHAAGQVAGFVTSCTLPAEKFQAAVASRLPEDVAVLASRVVHPEFHATRCAVGKLYRYRIHNAKTPPTERRTQRTTYHFWHPLSTERMQEAARFFQGKKDFSAMAARGGVRESMVRTVFRCSVERHFDEVRIEVEGSGFLYRQVRNMVGTLIQVGLGRWEPSCVAKILESSDRSNAGPTAPAHGLCLQWVRYPPQLLRKPE